MKKMTQKLLALLLGIAMLSSCVTENIPDETSEPEETTETTVAAPLTIDPETGEPIRVLPKESAVLSLEPQALSGDLVKTDTTFRIKTRSDMEADELSALLSVEPSRPIRVTKNGDRDYTLDVGTLPKGEIVKVTLGDGNGNTVDSWGFQTEDEFRVLSVFPADASDRVSVDSGIEIELSYPADAVKAGGYFEVSPPISGRFTNYSSTLVFVPNENMAKKTTYTVTLKKGLPSADGAALSEDYSFSFRTQEGNSDSFCYAVNGFSETYLPDDPVVIDVYHSPIFLEKEFDFKLYQYTNAEDYGNAIRDYYQNTSWTGEYVIPADGLPVVMDETLPLFHSEKKREDEYSRGRISSFVLPGDLEEGYYLAELATEMDGEEFWIQRLIQISSISVYAGLLSGQAMFFVNDTDSGNAAGNAEITFTVGGTDYSVKTDRDGAALLNYTAKEAEIFRKGMTTEAIWDDRYSVFDADRAGLLKIQYGGRVYYDRMNCVADRELTPEEKYFTYLFTDRSAYLTSDTVEIWGVIRPRKSGDSVPKNLTLKLGRSLSDGFVTDVTLSPDGTFTGKITYERLAETWWSPISLCDGETELCSINIRICDYEKPVYTLSPVLPEYVWMPQVNEVTAGVNISYYDGTPAEGRQVTIENSDPLVTDKNGYAERVVYMDEKHYWSLPSDPWRLFGVDYELSGIENEYLTGRGTTIAFIRDVGLDIEETRADDYSTTLSLNAYRVDIQNVEIEHGEHYAYPVPESYRGAPADLTVTAKITRYWDEKVESGSYYDFIQKKSFPIYKYKEKNENVGTFTAEVKNGVGSFQNLPTTDPNSGYMISLYWKDSEGRAMTDYVSFSRPTDRSMETDVLSYRLYAQDDMENPYNPAIGETRTISLRRDYSTEIPDFRGRVFYAIYQDQVLFSGVSDQPDFTLTMKEEYIPSFYMTGAYFDGKHIFPLEYDSFYYYSPEERRIDLELQTDRESYAPADTAEVTLTARTKDGKPIPNARILLSVVDEAAFAALDQTAQPLEELYRAVHYPMADFYVSYIQHTMYTALGGGGWGGGDPDPVRRKFLDTAYFAEGVSDANGRLTLSVGLPDNVTSWRFTALAFGEVGGGRLYAGTTRRNLSATLPLFITPIMLSEYVEGDEIVFSAVAAGDLNAEITAEVNGKTLSPDKEARGR